MQKFEECFEDEFTEVFGFKSNALATRQAHYLLVSDPLTQAEIDLLRQSKKSITEYVQKMYPDRASLLRACKQKAS